mgnify:CR=1 FL=1
MSDANELAVCLGVIVVMWLSLLGASFAIGSLFAAMCFLADACERVWRMLRTIYSKRD